TAVEAAVEAETVEAALAQEEPAEEPAAVPPVPEAVEAAPEVSEMAAVAVEAAPIEELPAAEPSAEPSPWAWPREGAVVVSATSEGTPSEEPPEATEVVASEALSVAEEVEAPAAPSVPEAVEAAPEVPEMAAVAVEAAPIEELPVAEPSAEPSPWTWPGEEAVATGAEPAEAVAEPVETLAEPVAEPASEPSAWTWDAEQTAEAPTAAAEVPAEITADGSDVILSPQVLEEPLPGMGWTPSGAPVTEASFNEEFPVILEEPEPYVAPEAELPEVYAETEPVEHEPAPTPWAHETAVPAATPTNVDDLKARIEETRRRIRHELEQPFLELGEHGPAPVEPESPPAARVFEFEADEDAVPEVEAIPEAVSSFGPDLMAGLEDGYGVVELDTGAETRPFPDASPAVEAPEVSTVPVEAASEQPPARPRAAEEVGLSSAAEAVAGKGGEPMELGIDYDAMRSRIERTRGRLKAKAFDAMMTGESTLLSKESAESLPAASPKVELDVEIDQTIETTLREEDR
ncbi:MAG TPA: hypothetical protein VIL51_04170, partial [Thermoleophilia bacterium]